MKKLALISLFYFSLLPFHLINSQWIQQTLPVSGHINDLAFLNKDTGFAALDNSNFLKTINGGASWNVISSFRIYQMCVADNKTLFGISVDGSKMYRTFDGGGTFDSVGAPGGGYCDFYFVNKDTGWSSGLTGIFMTTNSGNSFNLVSTQANCGSVMFFVRQKYNNEYYGFHIDNGLYKTTNSGVNWTNVAGISTNAINCFFLNKDTGWVTDRPPLDNHKILFTTNGGNNWTIQYNGGFNVFEIFFINSEKGWCGEVSDFFVLATTNSGVNWGTQSSPIFEPGGLFMIDSLMGWAYSGFNINNLMKTTNGGGNINAVSVINTSVPVNFQLYQNYPNPFNPSTNIEFAVSKRSFIRLIVFDVLGREIETIVNEELNAGTYKITWDASKYASGMYFYHIVIQSDKLITNGYTETKKMILLR